MTGQLRSTLQTRADQLDVWDVDLDSVVRAGQRRVRSRRIALAGGLAAVLAVAGGVTALIGRSHAGDHVQPADQHAKPLTYAVGSVVHSGTDRVEVGVKVESLVTTKGGFVYSGPDRTVYLWRHGRARPLGHLADSSTRLFVSDDGLDVAWWDGRHIVTWPGFHRGVETWPGPTARYFDNRHIVQAVSDEHLWFWDGNRTWIVEIPPLASSAVWPDRGFATADSVQDAAGDRVLAKVGDGLAVVRANLRPLDDGQLAGWRPGTDLGSATGRVAGVSSGDLAPDGRHWFATAAGPFTVYDSESGQGQTMTHPGFASATPYAWLGDDTIAALALSPHVDGVALAPVNLLVCQVSTNTCEVAAKDIGTVSDVVVGDGRQALP